MALSTCVMPDPFNAVQCLGIQDEAVRLATLGGRERPYMCRRPLLSATVTA